MAITFLEPGSSATFDTTLFTSVTGTVTSDATTLIAGERSLKCDSSTGLQAYVQRNAIWSAGTAGRVLMRFIFSALPAADEALIDVLDASNNFQFRVFLRTTGVLRLVGNTTVLATGTTVLSINTEYYVTLAFTHTTNTINECRVFLGTNTTPELTASNATLLSAVVDRVRWGWTQTNVGGSNKLINLGQLYCDDSNALSLAGNIFVTAKRPNANGTMNGFTTQIGVGGSGYGTGHSPQVNERPLSQTNGWAMIGAGSAITEEYNVENVATGDVNISGKTIVGSMGWVFAKSLVSETGQLVLNNVTTNIALTSTPTAFLAFNASSPDGAGADIGIVTSTTLTTVSLYEAGVIIAYDTRSRFFMIPGR